MSVTRDEWDEQLGRWRWSASENFVAYQLGEGRVRVVDEFDGETWQVLKEEVNIVTGVPPMFIAAARAYFKAQEPKPWLEAKPEEIWALDTGGEGDFHAWSVAPEMGGSHFVLVGGLSNIPLGYPDIAAGRRIWPEVADA